jgi:hypothetical protein
MCIFYFKSADFVKIVAKEPGMNIWGFYLQMVLGVMGSLLLPIYIIFMAYSVNNIEHQNGTWKSLFSLPLPRWAVYYSKATFAVLLVFICMMLFAVFSLSAGFILSILKPELKFQDHSAVIFMFSLYLKLFLSSIGILSIQFFMSLVWTDFIKPMGIGFTLLVASLIAFKWEYSYFIPYIHPLKVLNGLSSEHIDFITREIAVGLTIGAIAFVAGYFIVAKKSVK